MKIHALPTIYTDFETRWATDYTLSKMPTQAYIMDDRFHAHGACLAVNDGPIKWYNYRYLPAILSAIHAKYPKSIWVAHNALFDATILFLRYGISPYLIADTAGMSRALVGPMLKRHSLDRVSKLLLGQEKGKELAQSRGVDFLDVQMEQSIAGYCAQDVHLMREDYKIMAPHFPAQELLVMTWLTKMMTEPRIYLDQEMLWNYHHEVVNRKTKLLEELNIDRADLMSNDKFATLLDWYGVDPPKKLNAKGIEKWAFAKTDPGLKDLLEHENPDVQALVAARMQVKSTIEETRSETFAKLAALNPVGVPLAYSGALTTHRFSGRDKSNWQNLKRGGVLRKAILAPDGSVFVVSDLSQIELRITLWLAGHHIDVQRLNSGECLYSELATELYGEEVTRKNAKEDPKGKGEKRHVGKEATLGCGFGMGAPRFQTYVAAKGVKVELEFAKRAVDIYRTRYSGVPRLWRVMDGAFRRLLRTQEPFDANLGGYEAHFGFEPLFGHPGMRLPNGLWVKYPDLKLEDRQWTYDNEGDRIKIFGGHFLENLVQALARVIITEKTLKVNQIYPVVMSTHDELAALAPGGETIGETDLVDLSEYAANEIHAIMIQPVSWLPGLPIGAETGFDVRYGEAKS